MPVRCSSTAEEIWWLVSVKVSNPAFNALGIGNQGLAGTLDRINFHANILIGGLGLRGQLPDFPGHNGKTFAAVLDGPLRSGH